MKNSRKIYYNTKLKQLSRVLRSNSTYSERILWSKLKNRQLYGYQFSRQKPIGEYIVDFYCSKLKLVIEIDGITHSDQKENDIKRQKKLESLGVRVLRFDGNTVMSNVDGVLLIIENWIKKQMNISCYKKNTTP